MSKNYNNWCVDIYRGIFIERFNDTHIRVAPCCQATAVIEPLETFDFANNHFLAVLRNKFDLGEKPDECNRCWHDEQLGQNSRRINISANQLPDTTVELENLTYHSTWACNLACIMCGPHNSSTWAKELNMSSTKLEQIGNLMNEFPDVVDLLMVEDRVEHIVTFKQMGEAMIDRGRLETFCIHEVNDGKVNKRC